MSESPTTIPTAPNWMREGYLRLRHCIAPGMGDAFDEAIRDYAEACTKAGIEAERAKGAQGQAQPTDEQIEAVMNMAEDWGVFVPNDAEETEEDLRVNFEDDLRRVLAAPQGQDPIPTRESKALTGAARELLKCARDLLAENLQAFGACDHEVGICNCDMTHCISDIDAALASSTKDQP